MILGRKRRKEAIARRWWLGGGVGRRPEVWILGGSSCAARQVRVRLHVVRAADICGQGLVCIWLGRRRLAQDREWNGLPVRRVRAICSATLLLLLLVLLLFF